MFHGDFHSIDSNKFPKGTKIVKDNRIVGYEIPVDKKQIHRQDMIKYVNFFDR